MKHETQELLLSFFRVMANEQRVRIAAALMEAERTLAELADMLAEKPAVVLEHLAALRSLGLATASAGSEPARYSFDQKALYTMNRTLLSREVLPTPVDDLADEEARKVLRNFFEGQRLKSIPEGEKRFGMLVHWLVTCFEQGVRYSEKQVNEIITRYHEDYATLRRGMIDAGLMQRENGVYWRVAGRIA